jgi:hypothetical protein
MSMAVVSEFTGMSHSGEDFTPGPNVSMQRALLQASVNNPFAAPSAHIPAIPKTPGNGHGHGK